MHADSNPKYNMNWRVRPRFHYVDRLVSRPSESFTTNESSIVPHDPQHDPHRLTRRGLLSLAAVAAGGIALSPPCSPVEAPVTPPLPPTPTVKPGPPPLRTLDPQLTTPLKRAASTSGVISRFEGAFPALNIKDVVPLPGLTGEPVPWLAVSIVGTVNQLQIVNPDAGAPVHVISIPNSHNGGIGTLAWHRGSKTLFLTTSGRLMSWSPVSPKKLHEIGKVPGATSLYDLQLDSEGNVWGGTYPNGAAFSYTAATKKIRAHSRVSPDTDYVRRLAIGPDDQVWLGTGSLNPRLFTFPAATPEKRTEVQLPDPMPSGFISTVDVIGDRIVVSATDIRPELLLDPVTMKWEEELDRVWAARRSSRDVANTGTFYTLTKGFLYATDSSSWKDSKLGAVATGTPLAIHATEATVLIVSAIPTGLRLEHFNLARARVDKVRTVSLQQGEYLIQSLMGHSDGSIYIGGYMGDGLAAINPDSGERWHSPADQKVINQIEGMIEFDANRSYIGSYASSDIVSVTSNLKNSQKGYELLDRLARNYHQSRPFGWAANTKNVFFGTVPDYGRAGGVLGMIDPWNNEIAWVLDGGGEGFVKAHSVIGLAADERYVYGTSSVRNGYGISDTKGNAKVFKLEIKTMKKVWETEPVAGAGALYAPLFIAGWLLVADIEGIHVLDSITGMRVRRHQLTPAKNRLNRPGWANADLARAGDGSQVVHSAAGTTTVVDFRAGTKSVIGSPKCKPRFGTRLASTPSGRVFSSTDKTVLVELDLVPKRTTSRQSRASLQKPTSDYP